VLCEEDPVTEMVGDTETVVVTEGDPVVERDMVGSSDTVKDKEGESDTVDVSLCTMVALSDVERVSDLESICVKDNVVESEVERVAVKENCGLGDDVWDRGLDSVKEPPLRVDVTERVADSGSETESLILTVTVGLCETLRDVAGERESVKVVLRDGVFNIVRVLDSLRLMVVVEDVPGEGDLVALASGEKERVADNGADTDQLSVGDTDTDCELLKVTVTDIVGDSVSVGLDEALNVVVLDSSSVGDRVAD